MVKAAGYGVSFDPYRGHRPRVQHIGGRDQHPQRGGGWNDNAVVAIEQPISGLSYIRVIVCV